MNAISMIVAKLCSSNRNQRDFDFHRQKMHYSEVNGFIDTAQKSYM